MKIVGLKFMQDKGWKSDSVFTTDDGRTMNIPANHKFICTDENGDIINLTVVSPAPVPFKQGAVVEGLFLSGSVSKNSFGWTVKAEIKA